ncbi:hypothetical protein GEMRC1_005166 [Eukaryota sp. GEM-RC1]
MLSFLKRDSYNEVVVQAQLFESLLDPISGIELLSNFLNSYKFSKEKEVILNFYLGRLYLLAEKFDKCVEISSKFQNSSLSHKFSLLLASAYIEILYRTMDFNSEIKITDDHVFSSKFFLYDSTLSVLKGIPNYTEVFSSVKFIEVEAITFFLVSTVFQDFSEVSDAIDGKLDRFDLPYLSTILSSASSSFDPLLFCRIAVCSTILLLFKNFDGPAFQTFEKFIRVLFKYFLLSPTISVVSVARFPPLFARKFLKVLQLACFAVLLLKERTKFQIEKYTWIFELYLNFSANHRCHSTSFIQDHNVLTQLLNSLQDVPLSASLPPSGAKPITGQSPLTMVDFWFNNHFGNVRESLWALLSCANSCANSNSYFFLSRYLSILNSLRHFFKREEFSLLCLQCLGDACRMSFKR